MSDHVQISNDTRFNEFCEDQEVIGLFILPVYIHFQQGVLACKQALKHLVRIFFANL